MKNYLELLKNVLDNGIPSEDRTGTGTLSIFGGRMEFDLREGFPLVTTKKIPFRIVAEELFWMLRGETNIKSLQDKKVHIWDEWANSLGETGKIYGHQWREWDFGLDQIRALLYRLKNNPYSRRHILTAWNPSDLDEMALPPCHILTQFYVRNGELSCQMYQRSGDMFLGIPFNIASYSLLTHLIADLLGFKVGKFIHVIGDAHIYNNHIDAVKKQLSREPRSLPTLIIKREKDFPSLDPACFNYKHLQLTGYNPHPTIKAEVAV